jgi:putative protein-disulfide isomerase
MTTHFLYLFDPLCGWCYGASAGIATLADQAGVTVEPLPGGLFAGDGARALGGDMRDHILASDRRIAASTGAVFGAPYRDRIVRGASLTLDSGPATLALTAVAQTTPNRELDALREIQRARYIDGRDIADVFVLIELLVDAGLDAAAVTLANPEPALREADRQRLERARLVMQHFGTNGVPALFRIDGTVLTPVDATSLYQDPLSLISSNHLA